LNELQLEIFHALGLAGAFMAIFLLGEAIRRIMPSSPEISRKFVHLSGGITALSFPYLIKYHWTVLGLAAGFSLILVLAKIKGVLKSVHDVERKSYGAMLFPVSVYIVFLLGHNKPVLYFVSILIMTVSDTLAAVVGGRYGSIRYEVEGITKSLEGSTVFFFVTFLCVHLSLLLMTGIERLDSVLIALVIAVLVTGFEAISPTGSDNFFVPLGTYFILAKMMKNSLPETVEQLWILLAMVLATGMISLKSRLFKTTGLIGMILVNYAAWSLCGFAWFLPLFLGQILLYLLVAYFVDKVAEEIAGYQIMVLFYSALLPTLLIFAASATHDLQLFFIPYVTSIVAQLAIIHYFFASITLTGKSAFIAKLTGNRAAMVLFCAAAPGLCIATIPILLHGREPLGSMLIVLSAAGIAVGMFHLLYTKTGPAHDVIPRQQLRLLCASVAVATAFLLQRIFP
jgi:dolichol kinase